MAIRFKCTKCSHTLQVPEEHAGHKAKCPNCGQILPIPSGEQPKPQARPEPAPPSLGATSGPIPSLAKKSRKPPPAAKPLIPQQAKPPGLGQVKPPEMRSGKRAVIFGVVLVVLLAVLVVGWQQGWYGGGKPKKQPSSTSQRRSRTTPATDIEPSTPVKTISAEEMSAQAAALELQLSGLEQLLKLQPNSPQIEQELVGALGALGEFAKQLPAAQGNVQEMSLQVARNREWVYEKIYGRAGVLLSQYRFRSVNQLLQGALANEVSVSPAPSSTSQRSRSSRRPKSSESLSRQYEQACRNLAGSQRIERGLKGEVCIWLAESRDEFDAVERFVRLDLPTSTSEPQSSTSSRRTDPAGLAPGPPGAFGGNPYAGGPGPGPPVPPRTSSRSSRRSTTRTSGRRLNYEPMWGSATAHLTLIRKLQTEAEASEDTAQAGRFYSVARDLERRCVTFETPGAQDADLIQRLSGRKADRQDQIKIKGLIGQGRYGQALELAEKLVGRSPGNPTNHLWRLRCRLESCNAGPLGEDVEVLLRQAADAARISKYELPNNLLAVSLQALGRPRGLGSARYGQFIEQRESQVAELAEFAGKYAAVTDWLQGESRDMVLQDFKYRPFLSGEPMDLLDKAGVVYTLYSRGAPAGATAVLLARVPGGGRQAGLGVQLPEGGRYILLNIFAPEEVPEAGSYSSRTLARPTIAAVFDLAEVSASELDKQSTVLVLNNLESLRCEASSSGRGSAWVLRVPRLAVPREQLSQESPGRTYAPGGSSGGSGNESRYIHLNFPSAGRSTRSGSRSKETVVRTGPISCLVPDRGGQIEYFSDADGQYLLGPNGRRFYLGERGTLSTRAGNKPDQHVALDIKALPRELEELIEAYYQTPTSGTSSPGSGSMYGGAPSSRPPGVMAARPGPFTIVKAALWVAQLAEEQSGGRSSTRSTTGTRTYSGSTGRTATSPPAGRWLSFEGKTVAMVGGRMVQVPQAESGEPMFYTADAAADLLKAADAYYRSSLEAWPTLAGEVYREINNRRLAWLIGSASETSGRTSGKDWLSALDLDAELSRAETRMQSGDYNQTLAISGDLIGVLSLRLRRGMLEDAAAVDLAEVFRSSSSGTGIPNGQPDLFPDDLKPPSGRRTGLPSAGQAERFFLDGDMLVTADLRRALAFERMGMRGAARQCLRQASSRLRGYLLAELSAWSKQLEVKGGELGPQMKAIRQRWQTAASAKPGTGLKRALQAAGGEAMTAAWPNKLDLGAFEAAGGGTGLSGLSAATGGSKPAGGWLASVFSSSKGGGSSGVAGPPAQAAMTLAQWLEGGQLELNQTYNERLFTAAEFGLVRSMVSDSAEKSETPVGAAERAQRTIELAKAYETSGSSDPATARALWELGSFMAGLGYRAEAWECLGHAAGIYHGLAEGLLTSGGDSADLPEKLLRRYLGYRIAALSALAEAAAMPEDELSCPEYGSLLLGEIEAKLAQIRRQWSSSSSGGESLAAVLGNSAHAVEVAQQSASAQAYEHPRVRFWWWYYPAQARSRTVTVRSGSSRSTGKTTAGDEESKGRPSLLYIPGSSDEDSDGQRGRNIRVPSPQQPMLPPTTGSRLGI